MLFMPIYFVLGQHDVQSPSRHDSEVCPDLLRGEGTIINLLPGTGTRNILNLVHVAIYL